MTSKILLSNIAKSWPIACETGSTPGCSHNHNYDKGTCVYI